MKTTTKSLLCTLLSFGLAITSCQRDDMDAPTPQGKHIPQANPRIDVDSLRLAGPDPRLPNVVPITLHASGEFPEEFRALQLQLVDRGGTDYNGQPYANEFRPTLSVTKDNIGEMPSVPVYLTLVKLDAAGQVIVNSVHSQVVYFQMTEANAGTGNAVQRNGEGRYTMEYHGHITLPNAYRTLGESTETWYIMGMFNYYSYAFGSSPYFDAFGHTDFRISEGPRSTELPNFPFASNWTRLYVDHGAGTSESSGYNYRLTDDQTPVGERLHFKPLGVLLQIEEGENIHAASYSKFDVIVSNALDFSVRFDFSPTSVKAAFDGRDQATGIGVPSKTSVDPTGNFAQYFANFKSRAKLYNIQDNSYPLSSNDKAFPWDMPSLEHSDYALTKGTYSTIHNLSQGEEATASSGFVHYVAGVSSVNNVAYWRGIDYGRKDGGQAADRRIRLMWGMPKSVKPQNPYTYIFSGTYGVTSTTNNVFSKYNWFDIYSRILDPEAKLYEAENNRFIMQQNWSNYNATVQQLEAQGDYSSATYRYAVAQRDRYANDYNYWDEVYKAYNTSAYQNDRYYFYGTYYPEYLAFANIYSQPIVPIYQTNYDFYGTDGKPLRNKVLHIQSVRTADLLITEVFHKEVNGYNYSAVEIYNPMATPAKLEDYAIVRLRSTAQSSRFLFLKSNGQLSSRLTEAQIFPLEALRPNSTTPLATSGFSRAFSPSNSGSFAEWRRKELLVTSGGSTINYTQGDYAGQSLPTTGLVDAQHGNIMPLSPNQTILIGASGYINRPVSNSVSWWNDQILPVLSNAANNMYTLRHFIAYADGREVTTNGASTLDLQVGDGFALIKKTGDGEWQIIDATVPIGTEGYGFSGTFSDYVSQYTNMTKDIDYSQRRFHDIQYPFIFPYRTKRMNPNRWCDDWELDANYYPYYNTTYTNVYNHLGYHGGVTNSYLYNSTFSFKRTPLSNDPEWIKRYKQGRPVQR